MGGQSVLNEIAQDPILSHCKLISESWDLGGYYVGDMPAGWSEWNGKYRDVVRKFIKGDFGQISDLVKRISEALIFLKEETVLHTTALILSVAMMDLLSMI